MAEAKRRENIEKIQARQRRYRAQGRCWCGRSVKPGYKRCDKCVKQIAQQRARYVDAGRCYCANPVIPARKPNGTLYKTCPQCREREKARYQQRKQSA